MASIKSDSVNDLDYVASEEFLNLGKNKNKRKRFPKAIYSSESDSNNDDSSKNSKKKLKRDSVSEKEKSKQKANELKLKAFDIYSDGSGSILRSSSSSSSKGNYYNKEIKESSTSKPSTYVLNRRHLNLIRLSGLQLERFVHIPFFDRIAKGCYVKVSIGEHNNAPVYKVAEVIDVCETAKTYTLGETKTNKGLKVRHGNQEQVVRLGFVSNQDFSDLDYHRWIEASAATGNDLPAKSKVNQKKADILEAINYEFNVSSIIQEKQRFKSNPIKRESAVDAVLSKAPAELKNPQQPDAANELAQETAQGQADLFSAHDFDITIDIQVSIASTPVNITESLRNGLAPKRCLNLQDYKKKRGLI